MIKWQEFKSIHCFEVFEKSIQNYHVKNSLNQEEQNPYEKSDFKRMLYSKNWIDTVQWHHEDEIRIPNLDLQKAFDIKKKIDWLNQQRTDLVEKIDDFILEIFKDVQFKNNARFNTESSAWVIDRMSILALKIYHMKDELSRDQISTEHKDKCEGKLELLTKQKSDLSVSFDELLADIANGLKRVHVYRQVKMYNDKTLNPALR